MKKLLIGLLMLMTISLSSCGVSSTRFNVQDGSYNLSVIDGDTPFLPCVKISESTFTFEYDVTSSYLSVGKYEINDNRLTLRTNDEKFKYTFRIDGDSLFFIESESSDVSLNDEKIGIKINDGSEFILNNQD